MASDGTIHSETVPFGDLIAAYALFEKACVDSRRAYCECKQKTPAPFACQDYARVVKKDYEKQLDRLYKSACKPLHEQLAKCLVKDNFRWHECMKLGKEFRACVEKNL
ncbi:IMS import disulfide relay-system CHCH-CHCH-like Cx9C domain-containing protein [Plasmodiophora brassicae]|uniref:IMS import disulfide relay-system CHCH-CHCH-like Cx9C domain-containing protein n=1 Tax=Plasmodiophora brassicae TaxID=37360 RepID=A0A0G4J5N8_PLABS|nr:hypothetical protein PBRA_002852 [Plasmodiophora brassicae]SPQ94990.1 unnamed protein product [Plasmodiophora brassicae]